MTGVSESKLLGLMWLRPNLSRLSPKVPFKKASCLPLTFFSRKRAKKITHLNPWLNLLGSLLSEISISVPLPSQFPSPSSKDKKPNRRNPQSAKVALAIYTLNVYLSRGCCNLGCILRTPGPSPRCQEHSDYPSQEFFLCEKGKGSERRKFQGGWRNR